MNEAVEEIRALRTSVELLVRLKLEEVWGERTQKEMIQLLDSCGCTPTQIASLLKTTTNTVNPVLSRDRRVQKAKMNGTKR